jgi:hypothetical protein
LITLINFKPIKIFFSNMGNAAQRRNQWAYEKSMQRNLPHCLPPYERRPEWIGPRREEYEDHVYDDYQFLHYNPVARDKMSMKVVPFQMCTTIAWPPDGDRLSLIEEAGVEMAYFRIDPLNIEVCRIPALELQQGARCKDRFTSPPPPELNRSLTCHVRACDVRRDFETHDYTEDHIIVPDAW